MTKENITWKSEKRKISELIPAPYNPRELTEQQSKDLSTSLERFNLADPIVINSDNTIIGGHQRINILKQSGDFEVDVRVPSRKLTEHEEKELNLRLNKNLGQWDYDLLANFDEDLLKDVGFDSKELDRIFQLDTPEADDVPEVRAETGIVRGDLFQLGEHRLLCGDATKKEDVERLMAEKKADMVFTDPPYGMGLQVEQWNTPATKGQWVSNKKNYQPVIGDDKQFNPGHIFDYFNCKEIILWGADYYSEFLPKGGSWFVWDKRAGGLENVKWSTSEFELCWSKEKHHRQIARFRWMGVHGMERQDTDKRIHPTQKPVELCEWFIEQLCKRDNVIVDVYGGSGSTLIACEKLNRKCRMMEIDPIYCQVIIDRWEKFTGKKAEKCELVGQK